MKYGLQQFFVFSPKEWRGVLVFLLVVLTLWFWPTAKEAQQNGPGLLPQGASALAPGAGAGLAGAGTLSPATGASAAAPLAAERFYFDPNQLDSLGWLRLGLSPLPLRRLLHYRQKGGRFRQPHDLYRIWDMDSQWVSSVLPWVKLPAPSHAPYQNKFTRPAWADRSWQGNSAGYSRTFSPWGAGHNGHDHAPATKKPPLVLDINAASAAEWEALPGIGPVLAQRILRFRQSIGGFKQVEQVAQTYGLPTEVFQSILPRLRLDSLPLPQPSAPAKPAPPYSLGSSSSRPLAVAGPQSAAAAPPGPLASLPLNQASVADWQALGLSPSLAQAIVTYRRLYGPFQAVSDLKKIPLVNDSVYQDLLRRLHW